MDCLRAARELALPDWALGAGFVQPHLGSPHHKAEPTLNDIDLIYLDSADPTGLKEADHEAWLAARMPGQRGRCATRPVHLRQRCLLLPALSALSHWVEIPTCIGSACWQMIRSSGWPPTALVRW
jgi:hypothetical protein